MLLRAVRRADRFSWDATVERTLEVYEQALGLRDTAVQRGA